MRLDSSMTYKMSRHEAAMRFIEAFMTAPEKDRGRLVAWWNADNGGAKA